MKDLEHKFYKRHEQIIFYLLTTAMLITFILIGIKYNDIDNYVYSVLIKSLFTTGIIGLFFLLICYYYDIIHWVL